jgi:hypothetical protein
LARDPRLCLHTATADPRVSDGDAKIWGIVTDNPDTALHRRFAQALFDDTGFDIREEEFDHYFTVDITGASAVEVSGDHLDITVWKPGAAEYVVRKH